MRTFGVMGPAVASLARPAQAASPAAEASARLLAQAEPRIKAIYETNEFAMRSFRATWLPDGSGYLRLETPAGASAAEIASYDACPPQVPERSGVFCTFCSLFSPYKVVFRRTVGWRQPMPCRKILAERRRNWAGPGTCYRPLPLPIRRSMRGPGHSGIGSTER